jgi:hypothetical protein
MASRRAFEAGEPFEILEPGEHARGISRDAGGKAAILVGAAPKTCCWIISANPWIALIGVRNS